MNEQDQLRKIRHRIAVLRHAAEVTGNVAETCRYYGISRPTFYRWLHQWEELGEAGLRDTSSKPHHCPHQTSAEVVEKIMYLRLELPLRAAEDLDVPEALSRRRGLQVRRVAHPQPVGPRSAAGLSALQAPRRSHLLNTTSSWRNAASLCGQELTDRSFVFSNDADGQTPWRLDYVTGAWTRLAKVTGARSRATTRPSALSSDDAAAERNTCEGRQQAHRTPRTRRRL